jgi:ketosteroid isomerase-like protein
MMKALVILVILASLSSLVSVVPSWAGSQATEQGNKNLPEELHGIVARQQIAWNQGDIRQFMDAYWNDPALTFSSGGKTTRGWQATLDRYRTKYPDRATMGTLRFEALESQQLDNNSALTLGNWHLDRDKPARGNFSLVWKKFDGAWRIVHDHSSLLAE